MNKKINILLAPVISICLISFNQYAFSQEKGKQAEFYLPKTFHNTAQNKINSVIPQNEKPPSPDKLQLREKIKPAVKPVPKKLDDNPSISLDNYMKTVKSPYSRTFVSTLSALSNVKAEVLSFNSLEGKIYARLSNKKDVYIQVHSDYNYVSTVKITPSDGIYNISPELIKDIFSNIDAVNSTIDLNKKVK